MKILIALILALVAVPAAAKQPQLSLPIDCIPGKTCWLVNYADVDVTKGEKLDYRCGPQTYDGHKGTDFAVRDYKVMRRGVTVLAPAGGVVLGVRDGMDDVNFKTIPFEKIKGRECGNRVAIHHGDGWVSDFCHLRKGSVRVKKGDKVARGQIIGLVGLSGKTEFPHVHMTLHKGKRLVDPFLGLELPGRCKLGKSPVWAPETMALLPYRQASLYMGGVSGDIPRHQLARDGRLDGTAIPADAKGLFMWADIYWGKAGDKVKFELFEPSGKRRIDSAITLNKSQARRFVYMGTKRSKGKKWPAGTYKGGIHLLRNTPKGTSILGSIKVSIAVP